MIKFEPEKKVHPIFAVPVMIALIMMMAWMFAMNPVHMCAVLFVMWCKRDQMFS